MKKAAAWALCVLWMMVIFMMSEMSGDVSGAQSGFVTELVERALAFVLGGLVVWQHRANIGRLIHGNENKFSFHHKKEGSQ